MAFYDHSSDTSSFVISWTGDPQNDFGIFAKGYASAAERLAQTLLRAPRFSDYDAYPVVFLYRHALELCLKHIIYRCAQLAALRYIDDIWTRLYNNHRLPELMNAAARSLDLLFPADRFLSTVVSRAHDTCSEINSIDPDSFAFRYPMDKQGRYSTKRHLTLNLSSFSHHMSAVLEDLDTIRFGLSGEIDIAEGALYEAIRDSLQRGGEGCTNDHRQR